MEAVSFPHNENKEISSFSQIETNKKSSRDLLKLMSAYRNHCRCDMVQSQVFASATVSFLAISVFSYSE